MPVVQTSFRIYAKLLFHRLLLQWWNVLQHVKWKWKWIRELLICHWHSLCSSCCDVDSEYTVKPANAALDLFCPYCRADRQPTFVYTMILPTSLCALRENLRLLQRLRCYGCVLQRGRLYSNVNVVLCPANSWAQVPARVHMFCMNMCVYICI